VIRKEEVAPGYAQGKQRRIKANSRECRGRAEYEEEKGKEQT
jgi:hypothetical protein